MPSIDQYHKRRRQATEANQRYRKKIKTLQSHLQLEIIELNQQISHLQHENDQLKQQQQDLQLCSDNLNKQLVRLTEEKQQVCATIISNIQSKHPLQPSINLQQSISRLLFNLHSLFVALPHNSIFRKALLLQLSPSINTDFIAFITSLSKSTIKRSQTATNLIKQSFRTFKIKRKLASFNQIEEIMNEICPIVSGRNYRVIRTTFSQLYQQYLTTAKATLPATNPGSYIYFLKYLQKQNIHHNPFTELCPHCEEFGVLSAKQGPLLPTELAALNKQQQHKALIPVQLKHYTNMRQHLSANQLMCILDFSQFQNASTNYQDLIVATIDHNNIPKYHHYFGESKIKNDIRFVGHVFHQHLLEQFNNYNDINLWTDGGPKHFKITPMLNMIHKLAKNQLQGKRITYHFFPAYHGHSICDAAASYAKSALQSNLNFTQHTPQNITELCDIISKVSHHQATPIHALTTPVHKTKTLSKIRSYHKFVFTSECIDAYKTSDVVNFKQVVCVEQGLYPMS